MVDQHSVAEIPLESIELNGLVDVTKDLVANDIGLFDLPLLDNPLALAASSTYAAQLHPSIEELDIQVASPTMDFSGLIDMFKPALIQLPIVKLRTNFSSAGEGEFYRSCLEDDGD